MKKAFFMVNLAVFVFGYASSEQSFVHAADVPDPVQLDLTGLGIKAYYGDVCGDIIVFSAGPACDFTWDITCKNMTTGELSSFFGVKGGTVDNQPKIDGDLVVWCGGPKWKKPWTHEPSNFSVFVRNIATGAQKTLREYTLSESYSHPAISGHLVVWIEHRDLDPSPKGRKGKNWWNTPYSICGADITDMENPKYFTIAENVGKRDPYPCLSYWKSFDNVIDISGSTVVWEANGDIYGADISDPAQIDVFTICDDKNGQYNPAICDETVVWTDQRNDDGDIYGASILDMKDIKPVAIIKESGIQNQPAIDGDLLAYICNDERCGNHLPAIEIVRLTSFPETEKIKLKDTYPAQRPAVNGSTIVWRDNSGQNNGIPRGMTISKSSPAPKIRINPNACAM